MFAAGVTPAVVDVVAIRRHALGRTEVAHTMSRSFYVTVRHPVRKWPVVLATTGLLWHLGTGWNPAARLGDWAIRHTTTQGVAHVPVG